VIAAARQAGVFLMEAFMYRCHPLLRELDSLPGIEAAWPAMSHADTLGNMHVLDAASARRGLASNHGRPRARIETQDAYGATVCFAASSARSEEPRPASCRTVTGREVAAVERSSVSDVTAGR
jgi:hypothetical protein